jgi:hypothetical protein
MQPDDMRTELSTYSDQAPAFGEIRRVISTGASSGDVARITMLPCKRSRVQIPAALEPDYETHAFVDHRTFPP